MMSKKYLDTIENATYNIKDAAQYLRALSKSFSNIGNESLSRELSYYAIQLMEAQKDINEAVKEELSERLDEAKKSAGNLLSTILDVASKDGDA